MGDIGNVAALQKAREKAGKTAEVPMAGEAMPLQKFVIKFFADENVVKNRATRGRLLKGFVPAIEVAVEISIIYIRAGGDISGRSASNFERFLAWAQEQFWKTPRGIDKAFQRICRDFMKENLRARREIPFRERAQGHSTQDKR